MGEANRLTSWVMKEVTEINKKISVHLDKYTGCRLCDQDDSFKKTGSLTHRFVYNEFHLGEGILYLHCSHRDYNLLLESLSERGDFCSVDFNDLTFPKIGYIKVET